MKAPALPKLVVPMRGAMKLLDCQSKSAFHREAAHIGLAPYRRGKYRIADIETALCKTALRAQQNFRAQQDALVTTSSTHSSR
jgi:hypothetical protein